MPSAWIVIRSAGGGAWKLFRLVRIPGALPSLFAGLRVAAPSAVLGAVIGEYLGASEGLGVALIQAQSSFEVSRTWGVALVLSALAALLYAAVSLIARLAVPWESREAMVGIGSASDNERAGRSNAASAVLFFVASIAAVILAWYGLIWLFQLDNFFAKTPLDVWSYLVTAPDAAAHRAQIFGAMGTTLIDAGTGYVAGTAAALAAAVVMAMLPAVEQAVMPTAIVLRSIPIVAMAPLIALVFGRGLVGVTVVVGLVTFFPTLVLVIAGLRSAPAQACDVIIACGGSRFTAMRKVQMPYALPALFAAARIAAPAAIGGATLAEWLATGSGAGNLLVLSYAASKFSALWAASVVIVTVSVMFYVGLGMIQAHVGRLYGTTVRHDGRLYYPRPVNESTKRSLNRSTSTSRHTSAFCRAAAVRRRSATAIPRVSVPASSMSTHMRSVFTSERSSAIATASGSCIPQPKMPGYIVA